MSTGTQYLLYQYEKIEPNFSIRAAIANSLSAGSMQSAKEVACHQNNYVTEYKVSEASIIVKSEQWFR